MPIQTFYVHDRSVMVISLLSFIYTHTRTLHAQIFGWDSHFTKVYHKIQDANFKLVYTLSNTLKWNPHFKYEHEYITFHGNFNLSNTWKCRYEYSLIVWNKLKVNKLCQISGLIYCVKSEIFRSNLAQGIRFPFK